MTALVDISVIIPVFNAAEFVKDSVYSVLDQDANSLNFEIILINDASTDGSKAVLDSLKDERIRHFEHPENRGLSAARNTGLRMAEGEWVLFLDSDDKISSNLFSVFEKSRHGDFNCYVFSMIFEYERYREFRTIKEIKDKRAFSCLGSACNKFIKREICLEFKEGYLHEDLCFNVDMMNAGKLKIALLSGAYYLYNRQNITSITSKFNKERFIEMFNYLYRRLEESDDLAKKYVLEISLGLVFHMPFFMSVTIALKSSIRLFRYLPEVLFNGMRRTVRHEIVRS